MKIPLHTAELSNITGGPSRRPVSTTYDTGGPGFPTSIGAPRAGSPPRLPRVDIDPEIFEGPWKALQRSAGSLSKLADFLGDVAAKQSKIEALSEANNAYADAVKEYTGVKAELDKRKERMVSMAGSESPEEAAEAKQLRGAYVPTVSGILEEVKKRAVQRITTKEGLATFAEKFRTFELQEFISSTKDQQKLFRDYHEGALFRFLNEQKRSIAIMDDPVAALKAMKDTEKEIERYGDLLPPDSLERIREKYVSGIASVTAMRVADIAPDQFNDSLYRIFIAAGAKPDEMVKLREQAGKEAERRRDSARKDEERLQRQVDEGLKAGRQGLLSSYTGKALDLGSKSAGVGAYRDLLERFEIDVETWGIDRTSDDYRRVRSLLEEPNKNDGVDDRGLKEHFATEILTGRLTNSAQIEARIGNGLSRKTANELIKLIPESSKITSMYEYREGVRFINEAVAAASGSPMSSLLGGIFATGLKPEAARAKQKAEIEFYRAASAMAKKQGFDPVTLLELATRIGEKAASEMKARPSGNQDNPQPQPGAPKLEQPTPKKEEKRGFFTPTYKR